MRKAGWTIYYATLVLFDEVKVISPVQFLTQVLKLGFS